MEGLRIRWLGNMEEIAKLAPLKRLDELESGNNQISDAEAARILADYHAEGMSFNVAECGPYSLGFGIGKAKSDYYFVNKVYVLPAFRRKGIGAQIEQAQRDYAKALGLPRIMSYVSWDNEASVRMQQKLGAKKIFSNTSGFLFSLQA